MFHSLFVHQLEDSKHSTGEKLSTFKRSPDLVHRLNIVRKHRVALRIHKLFVVHCKKLISTKKNQHNSQSAVVFYDSEWTDQRAKQRLQWPQHTSTLLWFNCFQQINIHRSHWLVWKRMPNIVNSICFCFNLSIGTTDENASSNRLLVTNNAAHRKRP